MISDEENRVFWKVLQAEIAVVERARDTLRPESHLRALCDLAAERLAHFLPAGCPTDDASAGAARAQHQSTPSNSTGVLAGTLRRTSIDPLQPVG
jgi:hypothetical protein